MTAPALVVEGVAHAYGGRPALEDVSLAVPRGGFVALLGPNGAGKSTLFALVTRLFAARAGRIAVCGFDLNATPGEALRRLGVVFQARSIDATMTVAQNLVYGAALHGIPRAEALARGEAAAARLGIGALMDRRVATLSGGEARRAEIARALLHRPELLLCDEPTVGLDPAARAALVADTHRLAAEEGVGVLWATHLIDEVGPEDSVVVLHRGRVRATGVAAALAGDGALADAFLALTREPA